MVKCLDCGIGMATVDQGVRCDECEHLKRMKEDPKYRTAVERAKIERRIKREEREKR